MKKKSKVLQDLERTAPILPTPMYWTDTNSVILGVNAQVLQKAGVAIYEEFVGKTLYDLYPREMADRIKQHNEEVMRTGQTLTQEEVIRDVVTGEIKYFTAIKSPLYDGGKIIGVVATSLEITDQKATERLRKENQFYDTFQAVVESLSEPIYWQDANHIILGVNQKLLEVIGTSSHNCFLGKTASQFFFEENEEDMVRHDEEVLRTGKIFEEEKMIQNMTTGEVRAFKVTKTPLRDSDGYIIGLVGTLMDLTAQREADRLKSENQFQKMLERVANIFPTPVYWENLESVILGGNEAVFKATGAMVQEAYVGKSLYELYPAEMAEHIKQHNEEVMRTGETLFQEEVIRDLTTGETKYFTAFKAPLYDDENNIIGLIGTSIDITAQKEAERLKSENQFLLVLQRVMQILPIPIYWEDVNSRILGANRQVLEKAGVTSYDAYVGKTLYELYPKEMADHIKQHNEEVMRTGEILTQEEVIKDITTKETKYFTAVKGPLRDDEGNIVGIIGTSIDITAQKEAEKLRIENTSHKKVMEAHERFRRVVEQVMHDIRSPLDSIVNYAMISAVPDEKERYTLRHAAMRINDIAHHLLNQAKPYDGVFAIEPKDGQEPLLVSSALDEIVGEKKYEYYNRAIKVECQYVAGSHFAFVNVGVRDFKRMISNLINNAVQSFERNAGFVTVNLCIDGKFAKISIQDQGKGISEETVNDLMQNIALTKGKKDGYGIGLGQVRDTLKKNNGHFFIDSKLGIGTKVVLTFPTIEPPSWIVQTLTLSSKDQIIIADDDAYVHNAWDILLKPYRTFLPEILHFHKVEFAIQYLQTLSSQEKDHILLLTDYEFMNEDLTGLDIIRLAKVKRSILVTSHFDNQGVRDRVSRVKAKILPKNLVSEIEIVFLDPMAWK